MNLPKFYRDAGYKDTEVTDDVDEAVSRFYRQIAAKREQDSGKMAGAVK